MCLIKKISIFIKMEKVWNKIEIVIVKLMDYIYNY